MVIYTTQPCALVLKKISQEYMTLKVKVPGLIWRGH